MKPQYSFLALCIATSLYAPLVFAGASQTTSEVTGNTSGADPANGIGDIYSDIDMRLSLATKANEKPCVGDVCVTNQLFDARVKALGERLAQSAYTVYPDLKKKVPKFEFSVADKKNIGSASNASGKVVLFRGIQRLDLSEEATAFLLAREMGHVIANHHKSNAKTKLFFTVLTGVLFPAVSILSASSAAAQATTATTLLTSAASTATSFVGSEVALSRIKPTQLTEADDVSIALLEHDGLSKVEIAQALEFIVENENSIGWEKDLTQSIHYVRKLAGEPQETNIAYDAELELLPEEYIADDALTAPENAELSQEENLEAHSTPALQIAENAQIENQAIPLKVMLPAEQKTAEINPPQNTVIKPLEAKSTEPSKKVIVITNETLAESRIQSLKPNTPSHLPNPLNKLSVSSDKQSHAATVKSQANKSNTSTNKTGKNIIIAKTKSNTNKQLVKTSKNSLTKQSAKLTAANQKPSKKNSKKMTLNN